MFGRIEGVTQAEVNELSMMFLGLACLSFLVSYLQNVAWRQIGLKVSELVRSQFVTDALAQDVAFFEAHASGNTLLSHAISDAAAVQLGAGEKMGRLLQYSATFVFSFGVAFVRGWDLTLVMVGCIPFLAGSSVCILRLHKSMSNRLQEVSTKVRTPAYTRAAHGMGHAGWACHRMRCRPPRLGPCQASNSCCVLQAQGVALVAIQHIRFATAYNLQSKIMADFQAALDEASKVGHVPLRMFLDCKVVTACNQQQQQWKGHRGVSGYLRSAVRTLYPHSAGIVSTCAPSTYAT
jgi:ABC-type multidrug transport system fused ATPase/permease subunit